MSRTDYLGKTVAALGVGVPGSPPILRGFDYGVRFPGSERQDGVSPFSAPQRETVDPSTEATAHVLVLEPDAFDPDGEALVVIVDTGILRSPRLLAELQRLTSASPESPTARVFVPESARGRVHRADEVRRGVDALGLPIEVVSYYP